MCRKHRRLFLNMSLTQKITPWCGVNTEGSSTLWYITKILLCCELIREDAVMLNHTNGKMFKIVNTISVLSKYFFPYSKFLSYCKGYISGDYSASLEPGLKYVPGSFHLEQSIYFKFFMKFHFQIVLESSKPLQTTQERLDDKIEV